MSNDNNTQDVQKSEEKKRGERGELGKGTPGSRLKGLWHSHTAMSTKKGTPALSFKAFVKTLKDNTDVSVWVANKRLQNQDRKSDVKLALNKVIAAATKLQKRKKKGEIQKRRGGGGKKRSAEDSE